MNNDWINIKCPICHKGILFEIKNVNQGIIKGKCSWCKGFSSYDNGIKKYEILAYGSKMNNYKTENTKCKIN